MSNNTHTEKYKDQVPSWLYKFAFVAVTACGVALGVMNLREVYKDMVEYITLPTWITTNGVVTYTRIDEGSRRGGTQFIPYIEYTFKIGGKTYFGNQLYLIKESFYNKQEANAVIAKYPIDSVINLYYYPKDPNLSSIIKPAISFVYIVGLFLWSMIYILFFPVLIFLCIRQSNQRQK